LMTVSTFQRGSTIVRATAAFEEADSAMSDILPTLMLTHRARASQ
jgi:hypothetical protein